MTNTPSSPPVRIEVPDALNATAETAWACQCSVVVGVFLSPPAGAPSPLADTIVSPTDWLSISPRQYHCLTTPLTSPVTNQSSEGWKAPHVRVSGETNLQKPLE